MNNKEIAHRENLKLGKSTIRNNFPICDIIKPVFKKMFWSHEPLSKGKNETIFICNKYERTLLRELPKIPKMFYPKRRNPERKFSKANIPRKYPEKIPKRQNPEKRIPVKKSENLKKEKRLKDFCNQPRAFCRGSQDVL